MSPTHKHKNAILVALFLLVLLLCYQLAISKTFVLRKEYQALKQEEQQYTNIPQQLALLSKKEAYLDSILQKMDLNNSTIENNLLRVLNRESAANKVQVIDFNPPHVHNNGNTSLSTYNFKLRGNLTAILKVVYVLEQQSFFGEVVHVNFVKEKNYRTGRNYLEATIFVQNIQ